MKSLTLTTLRLAVMAALTLSVAVGTSAQSTDPQAAALEQYFQTKFGVTTTVAITSSWGFCPVGRSCIADYFLVSYSEGDGSGVAILGQSSTNPNSYGVLDAGGGVYDLAGLESLGFDAATAQEIYQQEGSP